MKSASKATKRTATAAKRATFSFESGVLAKRLLAAASERSRDVLTRRFGLGASARRETLEAIGSRSSITRERVRQIEAAGLDAIRASAALKAAASAFDEIARHIERLGAVVPEHELLASFAADEKGRNRFRFFLVVGSSFFRERETEEFVARWHIDTGTAKKIHQALSNLYASLKDNEVIPEGRLMDRFLDELKGVNDAYKSEAVLRRWLSLSKTIGANPLAEWGRASTPAIRTKGVRDYAYLAIKRKGTPMHFSEVAAAIGTLFLKKAHVATTHNELIKDPRFVLVGRGLYALAEWGYTPGVVRDVIREILAENGPLSREEIVEKVKRARFVKDNTILVNLNDPHHFTRAKNGRYSVA